MNHINEEWQMQIFDLLEGNLSKESSDQLLKLIEANPELKREYELLGRTYLSSNKEIDEIYTNKNLLYKSQITFWINRQWIKYAAAVFLISMVFGWFKYSSNTSHKALSINEKESQYNEKSVHSKMPLKPVFPMKEKLNNAMPKPELRTIKGLPVESNSMNGTLHNISQDRYNNTLMVENNHFVKMNYRQFENDLLKGNGLGFESNIGYYNFQLIKYPLSKKRTLQYKLQNAGKVMMALASRPSIKLITEKQENHLLPKVALKLSNQKLDIIATVIE